MTREEAVKTIAEKGNKMLNPQLSQWFSFRLNDFLAEGIRIGIPPHDIPLILECLTISSNLANEEALQQQDGIDFVAGKK